MANPCAPRCLTGEKYDRIEEGQSIVDYDRTFQSPSYTGGSSTYHDNSIPPAQQTEPEPQPLPSVAPSGGRAEPSYDPNILVACCPNKTGFGINCLLVAALCTAEAGASLGISSLLLLCDAFRRLSCVLLLVWGMEGPDLVAQTANAARSGTDTRAIAHRGQLLARGFVGIYLLGTSFFFATAALARMYGHDPPDMVQPGWLLLIGTVGLSFDVLHAFIGVKHSIYNDAVGINRTCWMVGHVYGSLFVLLEGFLGACGVGPYLDPIGALLYAGCIAGANMLPMRQVSADLYSIVVGVEVWELSEWCPDCCGNRCGATCELH